MLLLYHMQAMQVVQARSDAGGGMMPGRRAPMFVLGDIYELEMYTMGS